MCLNSNNILDCQCGHTKTSRGAATGRRDGIQGGARHAAGPETSVCSCKCCSGLMTVEWRIRQCNQWTSGQMPDIISVFVQCSVPSRPINFSSPHYDTLTVQAHGGQPHWRLRASTTHQFFMGVLVQCRGQFHTTNKHEKEPHRQ